MTKAGIAARESMHRTEQHTCYLNVQGKRVEVTQEVYQMICTQNNHIRYQARNDCSCALEAYSHCKGDCVLCPWHVQGRTQSFTETASAAASVKADSIDIEADVISRITMSQVYAAADQVVPRGAYLLRLHCEECCSNRELARRIGVSYTVVNRRMDRLYRYFRENLQLFF